MSILSKIAAPFEKAWGSLETAAKSVWTALAGVWGFLTGIANVLDSAWDWMVNGALWLGQNIEGWAAEVFNGLRHILFTVIPDAVKWVFTEAARWAGKAISTLANAVADTFNKLRRWVGGLIAKVEALAKDVFNKLFKWAREAVEFVARVGRTLFTWVTHPETLARFLLGHIALPLVRFMLGIAATLGALILRAIASLLPEIASAAEDLLTKVL